ncbi:MAG: hypothetical protein R3C43_19145 [Chloroflexota bacterium]
MTEPTPRYEVTPPAKTATSRLPPRAWNLAMRALTLEREMNGRGRATLEIIFLDGEWLISISRPGVVERLGE